MRAGIVRGKETPTASVDSTDFVKVIDSTTGKQGKATIANVVAAYNTANDLLPEIVAEVTLTSAQVLALFGTPITVIAAPAAGFAHIIKRVTITKAAGTAYAGIAAGEDLALRYTNASGSIAATAEMTGFADSVSATITHAAGASCLPVAAAAIVAHMTAGEITTGNSDFKLRITYETVAVPVF
jgi:hypothetical protein